MEVTSQGFATFFTVAGAILAVVAGLPIVDLLIRFRRGRTLLGRFPPKEQFLMLAICILGVLFGLILFVAGVLSK